MSKSIEKEQSKKKKLSFPTCYTIMLIVLILVMGLTYIVPSGKYATLSYNPDTNLFTVTSPNGDTVDYDATQDTLDELGVKIELEKFTNESIGKPVGIPGTYENIETEKKTIIGSAVELLNSPIQGIYEAVDIIAFVLVIGGLIGVVNNTGAFSSGIGALSRNLKGKELWLIVLVTSLIALGGTTFGLAEETIAFYPILIPIFIAAGYDALVGIASIYLGSSIGTMASTVNPFSTIIASDTAGINWTFGMPMRLMMLVLGTTICILYTIRYAEKVKKDPTKSLIYSQKKELEDHFLANYDEENIPEFNLRRKLILIIFAGAFGVMIYGVSKLGWWFGEMTALFLGVTIVMAFLAKLSEKDFVDEFVKGASDLLGVALLIGISRGITIIMDNGLISDSILYYATNLVDGMSNIIFSTVMFIIYNVLGFFISSSSGLAVLSMPVMAPLADVVGVGRNVIVDAYQYGQGLINFITPTGLVLASLALVDVTYDKWLKFVMPLVGILAVLSIVMLGIAAV